MGYVALPLSVKKYIKIPDRRLISGLLTINCGHHHDNDSYDDANEYFYSKYWNQHNQGFADMWFYSNSDNMNIFSTLYDRIFDYMKSDSDYIKEATTSWFDSNVDDEFSNEIYRNKKCKTK